MEHKRKLVDLAVFCTCLAALGFGVLCATYGPLWRGFALIALLGVIAVSIWKVAHSRRD